MKERGVFAQEKLNAMFNLIHETDGKAKGDDVIRAGEIALHKAIQRVGDNSEIRFTDYAKHLRIVKNVRDSTPDEDVYDGIDKWILFQPEFGLPELPVQIKSSGKDVSLFMNGDPKKGILPDPNYTKAKGIMVVVYCGTSIEKIDLKRQLNCESRRIKRLLNNNQEQNSLK